MKKHFWLNLFLVCVGIVVGSLTASVTSGVKGLSWLAYGLDFGTTSPFVLDLYAVKLTFGITVNITIATVICVVLSLIIGKAIARK